MYLTIQFATVSIDSRSPSLWMMKSKHNSEDNRAVCTTAEVQSAHMRRWDQPTLSFRHSRQPRSIFLLHLKRASKRRRETESGLLEWSAVHWAWEEQQLRFFFFFSPASAASKFRMQIILWSAKDS